MDHLWPVIMAGGVGSRFWPSSRAARPKQLLDLFGAGPMLRVTVDRIAPLAPLARQIIVTGESLGGPIRALLPDLPPANLLEEPFGRNTAPAIGWAAVAVARRDPRAVIAALPADHHIVDPEAFRATCARATALARDGWIVTVGIPATRPETGYGYIQRGEVLDADADADAWRVARFREKPDRATALQWLAEGGYLWNAGMFFMPAALVLDELRRFEPDIASGLARLDRDGIPPADLVREVYGAMKGISIDYAVMERTDRIAVVPGDFGWSDVGSWGSLVDFREPGASSFVRGRVVEIDGGGNVLVSEGGGVVAAVGVRDHVIVHTPDATLVCALDDAQRVREIVDALRAAGEEELL